MKKALSLLLILILSLTVFKGCGGDNNESNAGEFGDTLRVGSASDISTMDPTNFTDLQTQLAAVSYTHLDVYKRQRQRKSHTVQKVRFVWRGLL